MSLSIPTSIPRTISPPVEKTGTMAIPLYVYVVTLASLCIVIGSAWDISWHSTIGRDKLLSPPHIMIYLGAIFGALFSGIQVLWNSIRPTPVSKVSLIPVWGVFYSSLGALFCIWGGIAMLTSAPFDDWWHSAYGLDIVILSPPHSVLGLGALFLQFGAIVSICKYLNRYTSAEESNGHAVSVLRFLFIISASCLLAGLLILNTAFLLPWNMRAGIFYIVAAIIILLFLPAFGKALRMRWGMTAIAISYFLLRGMLNWILQLFPAEPKLGPILTHLTHFQPAPFPLLIVFPAIVMDYIWQRGSFSASTKAFWMSISFVGIMLLVQYPFSGFLMSSPGARNWFFGGDSWYYWLSPDWPGRYHFLSREDPLPVFLIGIGIAILLGTVLARISLRLGTWLQSLQR